MEITTKTCPRCGRELPTEKFYRNSKSEDGLSAVCRSCSCTKRVNDHKGLNPALAAFQPRELIAELRARGYRGELQYTQTIKL